MPKKSLTTLREQNLSHMIDHVFLPRNLPVDVAISRLERTEKCLVGTLCDVINEFKTINIPESVKKLFVNLERLYLGDRFDASILSEQIGDLQAKQMMGVYMRKANCGLFLMRTQSTDALIAATFQANLTNETIYGDVERPNINNDIQVDYPTRAVVVKMSDLIKSEVFAEQIVELHQLKRDKSDTKAQTDADASMRKYVSQWLIGAASDRDSDAPADFPIISKKMRDEPGQGFRRSGLWIALKVFLQLGLTIELGERDGKHMYKLIMLRFMSSMCNYMADVTEQNINADTAVEMLAKVGRRLEKIVNFGDVNQSILERVDELKVETTNHIKRLRHCLELHFWRHVNKEIRLSTQKRLKFTEHIEHELSQDFIKYLDQRKTSNYGPFVKMEKLEWDDGLIEIAGFDSSAPPDFRQLATLNNDNETLRCLCDIENWVLQRLDETGRDTDPIFLSDLTTEYYNKARNFYQNDPIGCSRMVLTYLKIIQVLDKKACEKYRIFSNHRTCINTNILENLVLTSRHHMKLLFELETYFKVRNDRAKFPGLIEENTVTKKSFAARLAKLDPDMNETKRNIELEDRKKQKEKLDEVKRARQIIARDRLTIARKNCRCTSFDNKYCEKCNLQGKINSSRVAVYRSILMPEPFKQDVLVFELRIPDVIACLRDLLYVFAVKHSDRTVGSWSKFMKWIEHQDLRQFSTGSAKFVFLGTNCNYLNKKVTRGDDYSDHPDEPDDHFIDLATSDYNCLMCGNVMTKTGKMPTNPANQSVKKYTTFSVEKSSVYEKLQWTVESTNHSQNKVLATQGSCPVDLSVAEYVNFGSLRADGHRLSLRNLYRVLVDESLSFETPSVLALVMQTLWQTGPGTSWHREAHEDFVSTEFVLAMVDLLDTYIQRQQENWKNPLKLMVATLIVCRMIEINSDADVGGWLVGVLLKFRLTAINWMQSIQTTIEKGGCNGILDNNLFANLVDVAICGMHTYFVNCHHDDFEKVLEPTGEYSAVDAWLRFAVTANHNHLLCDKSQQLESRDLLLRMAYTIGLSIESRMSALIVSSPADVQTFVRFRCRGFQTTNGYRGVRHLQDKRHNIVVDARIGNEFFLVQIDYVFGEFLVNSLPMGRLPVAITKHAIFKRMFGNATFEVQPKNRTFTTASTHRDHAYIFREDIIDGIVIKEQNVDSEKCVTIDSANSVKELIPHTQLIDLVPYLLIENYSHWHSRERDVIEFRPKVFSDPDFVGTDGIEYELNLESRQLIHTRTQRPLLDVRSESFKKIVDLMERLEHPNYINVLMESPLKARVELARMKLTFIIDCSNTDSGYDIQSNEYSDMRVSLKQQNIGTLFGLQFGLVLESMGDGATKSHLLIVPHAKFTVERTDHHVEVKFAAHDTELRSPPFFVYHINCQLRTLRANSFAAWFYLAHLHAVTSYPLPDPFTGMTGVERALQILQSGVTWSSAPYDRESMTTLQSLVDLSPIRRFQSKKNTGNGHHQQMTQWPQSIRPHAAQDAFVMIVRELMADSLRLMHLFKPNQKKPSLKFHSMISLNARSYARYAPYTSSNCRISDTFMKCDPRGTVIHSIVAEDDQNMASVRELAAHFSSGGFHVPSSEQPIGEFIFELFSSEKILSGRPTEDSSEQLRISIQNFCTSSSFANVWIQLYECIRRKQLSPEHLHLILTLFAFKGTDVRHLQILQAIAANQTEFKDNAPPYELYDDVKCYAIDEDSIEKAIDSAKIPIAKFIERARSKCTVSEFPAKEKFVKRKYNRKIKMIKKKVLEALTTQWPCERIDVSAVDFDSKIIYVDERSASASVDAYLRSWYRNLQLRNFTMRIGKIFESKLQGRSLPPFVDDQPEWPVRVADVQNFPKFTIDFDEKMCRSLGQHAVDIGLARRIFFENANDKASLEKLWRTFRDISAPESEEHLVAAELYPRLVPTAVFPRLLHTKNDDQRNLIGALAVMTCREQRATRNATTLDDSLHSNWKPHLHPEWLLFEIEMDLTIRRVQVEIANRMIHPPGGKHSVMQLNMGEGKTSVIVPIVAAELANGEQLCTVNVLRHLFETNLRSLRQGVGGLLGRRVYTLPCRRDMDIESVVDVVQEMLEECKSKRGILMMIPEHRLSLQLKIYYAARKNHFKTSLKLLHVHNWLNQNSRHILDESDAILQPNYQLIYSIGNQDLPEGGALRWTCIQALLKRVPHHMKSLLRPTGIQQVEFNDNYICDGVDLRNRPEIFPPCRLLDATVYDEHLKRKLAIDIASGAIPEFPKQISATSLTDRKLIREILTDEKLSAPQLDNFLDRFDNEPIRHTIFILSGLLKFGILKLALSKRWRVNYGRNVHGKRKMAVPFKAKDVAAEMTEFGHPDVAICLTQLSYYYSGLSDAELHEAILILDRSEDPNGIYSEWMRKVPPNVVPDSIKMYTGVNLSDAKQRDEQLFPILRRNMYVIDYWLSNVVFPREAKMFDEKLMCTAWDLCTEQLAHPVTGFSGTNDTAVLLPISIEQNDLIELQQTNEIVQQNLLKAENDDYKSLPANISGMAILEKLEADRIPVLLDAGALMLELNNEQVAREWLKIVPADRYDAAIYFSDKDIMLTIDRYGFIAEFEYSAYRERLDRCLVYLDDVHTRGTDLKFPPGMRACVTLSGGITHDKTVQACMRMRMLGQGHSISFWASQEAHIGIQKLSDKADEDRITTSDVIKYVGENSEKFKKSFISYWLSASLNYAQKLAAHKALALALASASAQPAEDIDMNGPDEEEGETQIASTEQLLEKLRERCSNPEKLKLSELYGAKKCTTLTIISRRAFVAIVNEHETNDEISDWITDDIQKAVEKKLKRHGRGVHKYTHIQFLDGECQKELEYELEENRQVYRPKTQKPYKPYFNKILRRLFHADRFDETFEQLKANNSIQLLPQALKNTKLFEDSCIRHNLDAWENNLWVTKDFRSVVQLNMDDNHDEFLRPVWWVVRVHSKDHQQQQQRAAKDTFVLISPYECNELMPQFRNGFRYSTLHMFSAKLSPTQSTLINNPALQIPPDAAARPVPMRTIVQLTMFAGSMYFENAEEETEYCNFMGIIPSPPTDEQAETLKSISATCGYIPTSEREQFPGLWCRFRKNPGKIAMGIIEMRHGYARKRSHAAQINIEAKRFKWNNNDH